VTPYLQLRLWWRRAPYANKLATSLTLAIVVAVAAWILIPTGGDDATNVTGVDAAEGATVAPGDATSGVGAPAVTTPTATGDAATGGGAAASTNPTAAAGRGTGSVATASGGTACLQAPSGTPGVTDKEIVFGYGYANLAGPIGNSAVGLGSPDEYKRLAQAVVDDINARGGVQCRKVVLKVYEGNPVNQDQTRATCLQVGQDRPFLFADSGAFAYPLGAYGCLPQQKIPVVTPAMILGSEVSKFSPYLTSVASDSPTEMRDVALGGAQQGFFDPAKGFKKLGLLYEDCTPEVNRDLDAGLARAGVPSGQTSKYVFSCPSSGFAPPNEMSQAVTQFKLAGVTHVIPLTGGGSFKPFTEIANSQGFKPRYLITNYNGLIITSATSLQPNPDNFDGSLAISTGSYGMDTTPGVQPDPGTRRCQAVIAKAGLPPDFVWGKQGGQVCSVLWTAEVAIKHARTLTREAALPGLFNAGSVQLAFPNPDTTFKAPAKFFGGDTWSTVQWHKDCSCWRILEPNRKPSFAP